MEIKACECKSLLTAFQSQHNPAADEWYCAKCHRSYLMNRKEHRTEAQKQRHIRALTEQEIST